MTLFWKFQNFFSHGNVLLLADILCLQLIVQVLIVLCTFQNTLQLKIAISPIPKVIFFKY